MFALLRTMVKRPGHRAPAAIVAYLRNCASKKARFKSGRRQKTRFCWCHSRMRRVGRPTLGNEPRKLIAIRLDPKVLGWLRRTAEKKGLPYQSLVNEILAGEMGKAS